MNRVMFACAVLLGLLFGSGGAIAQCAKIIQNGTVQNNAPVVWVAPCAIAQPGPSTGSSGNPIMINDLGVQGNVGILDAPITGPYHSAILGWSKTSVGEFDINLNGFGGANLATFAAIINGNKFFIPGTGTGNVSGPATPTPVAGDQAVWNGGLTLKDGPPSITPPSATTVGDCAFFGNTSGTLLTNAPCRATSTSALGSIPANPGGSVVVASGSAPPVTYIATSPACSFADGGYCFSAAVGGAYQSWVMAPQKTYDPRWWGISITSPMNFYANASTGSDFGGTNLCVKSSLPCLTMAQVITAAMSFCVVNQQEIINLAAGTYGVIQVNGSPPCNGGQFRGGGGNVLVFNGVGATTIITDPCTSGCLQYVVEAAQAGVFLIQNMQINVPSPDDGIFLSGTGDTVVLGTGVTLNGLPGASSAIHVEGQNRILQAKATSTTVTGSFINITNNTYNSNATLPGTWICSGVTFTGSALFAATQASTMQLNLSDSHTCPNTISPYKLVQDSTATIGTATFPTGAPPPILVGKSTTDQEYTPCVGGAAGCAVATAPTGFGTGATFAVTASSTAWSGQVQITAGSGAPSSGTPYGSIWLSSPVLLQTIGGGMRACTGNIGNGSGGTQFPSGSTAWVGTTSATGGTNFRIDYQSNGVALTNTNIYYLNYVCSD